MKNATVLLLFFLAGTLAAQTQGTGTNSYWDTKCIWPGEAGNQSLFHGLNFVPKTQNATMYPCPLYWYYDDTNPSPTTYTESLPSSQWAVRMTPAEVCTVWTVSFDFDLNNVESGEYDTLYIFLREATAPYTQLFQCYYQARPGSNAGEYEITPKPQNTPPATGTTVINTKRDFYVGCYVKGKSTHQVVWRFTTPAIYGPPANRSVRFTTPTTPVPVGNVLSFTGDMVLSARLCHRSVVPVELRSFTASAEANTVALKWMTETEVNNLGFEIYRAPGRDGPWSLRGFMRGSGTTTEPRQYAWSDAISEQEQGASPAFWYKLRQLDADGTFKEYFSNQVLIAGPGSQGYALSSVFPNPASSGGAAAVVGYRLAGESHVRIEACDVFGRVVAVLFDGDRGPGSHQVQWSLPAASGAIPSGRYFIRMQAGDHTLVRPLVVQH